MAYIHLTIKELIWIEQYHKSGEKVANIAKYLSRARQTIYNVINWLKKAQPYKNTTLTTRKSLNYKTQLEEVMNLVYSV